MDFMIDGSPRGLQVEGHIKRDHKPVVLHPGARSTRMAVMIRSPDSVVSKTPRLAMAN